MDKENNEDFICKCNENKPVTLKCDHKICLACAGKIKQNIQLGKIHWKSAQCPVCHKLFEIRISI